MVPELLNSVVTDASSSPFSSTLSVLVWVSPQAGSFMVSTHTAIVHQIQTQQPEGMLVPVYLFIRAGNLSRRLPADILSHQTLLVKWSTNIHRPTIKPIIGECNGGHTSQRAITQWMRVDKQTLLGRCEKQGSLLIITRI